MSFRDPEIFIEDMREACSADLAYTDGKSFDDFAGDLVLVDAVLYRLQVIGEAASRIPESNRARFPEVEWKRIVGFRNVVVHEYFGVDLEDVMSHGQGNQS